MAVSLLNPLTLSPAASLPVVSRPVAELARRRRRCSMKRRDFFEKAGLGSALLVLPAIEAASGTRTAQQSGRSQGREEEEHQARPARRHERAAGLGDGVLRTVGSHATARSLPQQLAAAGQQSPADPQRGGHQGRRVGQLRHLRLPPHPGLRQRHQAIRHQHQYRRSRRRRRQCRRSSTIRRTASTAASTRACCLFCQAAACNARQSLGK